MSDFFDQDDVVAEPKKADNFFDEDDIAKPAEPELQPAVLDAHVNADLQQDPGYVASKDSIPGLDSGKISRESIDALSKKYKVNKDILEKQAVRLGATYPDVDKWNKALARIYGTADSMLLNAPSKIAAKLHDDSAEQAIDEMKGNINKSWAQKTTNFAGNMLSPIAAPSKILKGADQLGKYATAGKVAMNSALQSGLAGFGNSESGEELKDTAINTGVGAVLGPLVDKGMKSIAQSGSSILGRGKDVSEPYLANPAKYNDESVTFQGVKDAVDAPISKINADTQLASESSEQAAKSVETLKLQLKEKYMEEGVNAKEAARKAEQAVKDFTTERVGYYKDQGKSAKEAAQSAADKYKALELNLKEAERTSNTQARETIKSAMDQARAEYADAVAAIQKPTLPEDMVPRVKDALKTGRKDVSDLSSESFDILERSGQKLDIGPLRQWINKRTQDPEILGVKVAQEVTPEMSVLRKYAEVLDKADPEQSPAQMKKLLQAMQNDLNGVYAANSGAYRNRDSRALSELEATVQGMLKSDKLDVGQEFAGQMRTVAEKAELINSASKIFGRKDPLPALYSLQNPSNSQKKEILQTLSSKYDPEIASGMQRFWDESAKAKSPAQRRQIWNTVMGNLKDPVTGAKVDVGQLQKQLKQPSQLPNKLSGSAEAKALAEAEKKAAQFTPDYVRSKAQEDLRASNLPQSLTDAEDALLPYQSDYLRGAIKNEVDESAESAAMRAAQERLAAAQAEQAKLGKWAKGDSEDLIRANMNSSNKKPNIQEQEMLNYLNTKTDANLPDMIDTFKVKNAFEGGGPNGSRLTNVGGKIGKAALAKFGPTAAKIGEAGGSLVGAGMDYTTGKTAKLMLDGYLKFKGPVVKAVVTQAYQIVDAVENMNSPKKEKYMGALNKAAEKGPDAVVMTNQLLMRDPEYKAAMEGSAP